MAHRSSLIFNTTSQKAKNVVSDVLKSFWEQAGVEGYQGNVDLNKEDVKDYYSIYASNNCHLIDENDPTCLFNRIFAGVKEGLKKLLPLDPFVEVTLYHSGEPTDVLTITAYRVSQVAVYDRIMTVLVDNPQDESDFEFSYERKNIKASPIAV